MIRAFVAIALPESLRRELALLQAGLPVPRVVAADALHLTLAFLGEVEAPQLDEAHMALGRIRAPGFDLALSGMGLFGGARPRAVYAGVAGNAALRHLQAKVETALRGTGLDLEHRRFVPHVTLARIGAGRVDGPRVERWVAAHGAFSAPPFAVGAFDLVRSLRHREGAQYEVLASYPLGAPGPAAG